MFKDLCRKLGGLNGPYSERKGGNGERVVQAGMERRKSVDWTEISREFSGSAEITWTARTIAETHKHARR